MRAVGGSTGKCCGTSTGCPAARYSPRGAQHPASPVFEHTKPGEGKNEQAADRNRCRDVCGRKRIRLRSVACRRPDEGRQEDGEKREKGQGREEEKIRQKDGKVGQEVTRSKLNERQG